MRLRVDWTCASATGAAFIPLSGATSPPRAATSRTMSYFAHIFRSTNLPASAGGFGWIFGAVSLRAIYMRNHEIFDAIRRDARHAQGSCTSTSSCLRAKRKIGELTKAMEKTHGNRRSERGMFPLS